MPAILVFLLGTGTGFALKYLWDKYKNFDFPESDKPISIPIHTVDFGNETETKKNTDKFYLQSISPLFAKYNVNLNEMDAFGRLCNKIRHDVRIDLLELLTNQTSIKDLLHAYQTEIVKPLQILFHFTENGVYETGDYLTDTIKNLGLSINANSSLEQKVELILNAYYAKGIEVIFSNFGKEFEKLESLNTTNDPTLENYYNRLKDDLAFHLKLLKK